MKPLLPAPYTPEDEAILFRHGRGQWATTLRASGLQADIRDAELMLSLREARILFTAAGYDHGLLASNTVIREIRDVRAPEPDTYYGGVPLPRLDISNCA